MRLHPALDSAAKTKVPRAGVSSQPSSGAASRRRRPYFSLCVPTPPAQRPSGPRLARAASHAVRLHPALDSAKVPRAGVSSLPSSGAVSRRRRPYFSLCDLTPPAQRPSRPRLARAACHAVRLHPALDSAKVPRAGVSSLPSSGAVSRRKRPKFGLSDPTPPAQGPSRPRLARAACHAVRPSGGRGVGPPCLGFAQGPAGGGLLPPLLRGSLETEAAQIWPEWPNSTRPGAVQAPISPGRVSRGASPPCLGFAQGPAGGGLLPALLRGSLETEAALFQPVRPNSARPAPVRAPISPGRLSRGASPPRLGFGQGPAGGGLLPPLLRGSLETEAALFQPVRPNSARPAAVQAPISPGRVSRGASPPCLGFGQGPAGGGLLPALLRGSLETEAALFQPVRPNSARPGAVRAPISPGRVSRGASPPRLGFGQGPAGGGLLPALLRGSLETEAAGVTVSAARGGRPPRLGLSGDGVLCELTLTAGRHEAAKTWAGGLGGGRRGEAAEKRGVSRHCFGRLGFCGLSRFLTQTLAGGCPAAAGVTVSAARAGQAAAARALRR